MLGWIAGEMTLELPSFLTVNHDTTTLKTTLSVLDPEVPAQRAMWGMCLLDRAFYPHLTSFSIQVPPARSSRTTSPVSPKVTFVS